MSMYRQLWLAIIVSMLLALLGSLLASTLGARDYLSEQLSLKNTDNAAALALSLSQQKPDATMVELAVSAQFDSGHYEMVRVVDPIGKIIAERTMAPDLRDVPAWFPRILPIKANPGQAQINNGWKQIGTVTVMSNSHFAYHALWGSIWQLILALTLSGFVAVYLGTLILRRLHGPLQAVINQAQAITSRRFIAIDEPRVTELRKLAVAMNSMVMRLKTMFAEEAVRLETVRREANCDPLTGLANRSFFMAHLQQLLNSEETAEGTLILVRMANLTAINHHLGRSVTDDLIKLFGKLIQQCAEQQPDALAARLNGADFALLLPGHSDTQDVAGKLLRALVQDCTAFSDSSATAFIGTGNFHRGQDMGGLLAKVDAALASAEADNINVVREAGTTDDVHTPRSSEEWSRLIHHALENHWVKLASFPVVDLSGHIIHRECPLRLKFEAQGEWLPAGRFLPIAERLGLTAQLDLAAVTLGLEELKHDATIPGLAINLSATSVQDDAFRHQLLALLHQSADLTQRLWLEVSEAGVLRHLDTFRILCVELANTGCHLGLEHFGRQFSQIGLLHDLGLDYLKVDSSFIHGLESNVGNQAFLKGLSAIAHNIGLQAYAEGVANDAELKALGIVGFDGATGPAIHNPA